MIIDLSILINEQHVKLESIEIHMNNASYCISQGNNELIKSISHQKKMLYIILIIITIPIFIQF